MTHEHEPPAAGDDSLPQPETVPVPGAATGNTAEPLPEGERSEQHEQEDIAPPQIWVGSLSDYNNGVLHGAWIDAARDPEQIQADITGVLAASPWTARTGEPAEEWGIFDTDNFGACRIDQHEDLEWVSAVAKGIAEHGPAFAAWADVMDDPERLPDFEEAYLGEYDSLEAYAEELISDLGYDDLLDRVVPPSLRPYVDINIVGYAQDMWLNGEVQVYHRSGGGVWLFNGS
jgi:antirestriction protein